MKETIGLFVFCIGGYFAAYSRRLMILRTTGYASVFRILDGLVGYGTYIASLAVLVVGIRALVRSSPRQPWLFIKSLFVIALAIMPSLLHILMFSWTYSVSDGNLKAKLAGVLTPEEWAIACLGWGLMCGGAFLIFKGIRQGRNRRDS